MQSARRLAHNIKGTAGNLSAVGLHFATAELEEGIKQGDESRLPELSNNFSQALKQLLRSIGKLT